jgi:hypothetical protein
MMAGNTTSVPVPGGDPAEISPERKAAAYDWSALASIRRSELIAKPAVDHLTAAHRSEESRRWAQMGLAEHASIASFARFTLELLGAGAPSALVSATSAAISDEIVHARACFALARHYGGAAESELPEPTAFPLPESLGLSNDLLHMALSTFTEGCVEETLSAAQLALQAEQKDTPAEIKQMLLSIASDEARHAALAWATVGWALSSSSSSPPLPSLARTAFAADLDRIPNEIADSADVSDLTDSKMRRLVADQVLRGWSDSILNGGGLFHPSASHTSGLSPLTSHLLHLIADEYHLLIKQLPSS